jgi:hypothetical protein
MRIAIAIIIGGLCVGGCATPVHEALRPQDAVPTSRAPIITVATPA